MNLFNPIMKKIIVALYFLLCPILALSLNHPLKVGIANTPPFTIVEPGSPITGISVMIWERIASMNNWSYQYVVMDENFDNDLKQVQDGTIDILIEPVPVTNKRLETIEFSRPILIHTVSAIIPKKPAFKKVFGDFLSGALIFIVSAGLILFLLYIHLIWFFERGKISNIPQNYRQGMIHLIWLHLLKQGLGFPTTICGRLILLLGIILVTLFFTSYNASLTSVLTTTLNVASQRINSFDDLRDLRTTGVEGQPPFVFAKAAGLNIRPVKTMSEAMNLLNQDQVDAVIANFFVGTYYLNTHPEAHKKYLINALPNQTHESGFILPYNSPLLRPFNFSLTQLRENKSIFKICAKYFTTADAERCTL